jgi:hypothetical protein
VQNKGPSASKTLLVLTIGRKDKYNIAFLRG